jgi:hypothetical protein
MTVTTTTVDLGPVVQIVVSFLGVVMPLIAAYIAWLIKRKMNIQQDSADALKIDTAAKRAGGIAVDFIKKVMPVNPTVEVRNAAIAQGLNHIAASLPDTVARMGITPDTLSRMVNSELAQLETTAPATAQATPLLRGQEMVFTPFASVAAAPLPAEEPALEPPPVVSASVIEAAPKTK